MERALNILVVAVIAAAGLQIAAVNYLTWNSSYSKLIEAMDLSALQAAYSVITVLF